MTYAAYEDSTDDGSPVELYLFKRGPFAWRFASGTTDVTYLGDKYEASPIKRTRIAQTSDIFKDSVKISFPRTNLFAFAYVNNAPEDVTSVTVFRGHRDDPDQEFSIYWKGRIANGNSNGNTIEVECSSVFTSIRRPGLRAKYEYGCRHGLYSPRCGANKGLFSAIGEVLSINASATVIQLTNIGLQPNGYYSAGIFALANGNTRFIVGHTGSSVTLNLPLNGIVLGEIATVYAGCDHLKATCDTKFGNSANFGGFPFIPVKNPFSGGSIA